MAAHQYDSIARSEDQSENQSKDPDLPPQSPPWNPHRAMGITKPKDCYKPLFIRPPMIVLLLLFTLAMGGLVEYACRTLPTEDFKRPSMMRARAVIPISLESSVPALVIASPTPGSSVPVPESVQPVTSSAIHGSYLDPILSSAPSAPPIPPTQIANSYLDPVLSSAPPVAPVGPSSMAHNSFLNSGVSSAPPDPPPDPPVNVASVPPPTLSHNSFLNPGLRSVPPNPPAQGSGGGGPVTTTAMADSFLNPVVSSAPPDPPVNVPLGGPSSMAHNSFINSGVSSAPPDPPAQSPPADGPSTTRTQIGGSFLNPSASSAPPDPPPIVPTTIGSSYLNPKVSSAPPDPPAPSPPADGPGTTRTQIGGSFLNPSASFLNPVVSPAPPIAPVGPSSMAHNSFINSGVSSASPNAPPIAPTTIAGSYLNPAVSSAPPDGPVAPNPPQKNVSPTPTLTQIQGSFLGPGVSSGAPDSPPDSLVPTETHASFLNPSAQSAGGNSPPTTVGLLPPSSFLNPSAQSPGGNSAPTTVGLLPPSSFLNPSVQPTPGQASGGTTLLPSAFILNPSASPGNKGGISSGGNGGTASQTLSGQGTVNPAIMTKGDLNPAVMTTAPLTGSLQVFTSTDSTGGIHLSTSTPGIVGVIKDSTGGLHTTTYSGQLVVSSYTDAHGLVHTTTFLAANAAVTKGPNRVDRPVHPLTSNMYFFAFYLPSLLAIFLRITIGFAYAATKMMEPFYSLADPAGALARDFFNINYLSTNDSFDPFTALFRGHWLMLYTSVLYVGAGLITPFASEFLTIVRYENIERASGPEIRVNPAIGRIIEGLLLFTAIMLIVYLIVERRHKSGIYSDPSSIAAMTCLFHHPEVVNDFKSVPPGATKKELEEALQDKIYRLDYYNHTDGTERYGIVPAQDGPSHGEGVRGNPYSSLKRPENKSIPLTKSQAKSRRKFHLRRVIRDITIGFVTAGLIVIVVWYYFNSNENNSFEKFLDSQQFGPRFVLSVFGILLHSQWKRIERETCIIQPFRRLKRGSAPAKSSINLERTLSPFTTFFVSLPRGHVFCALVAVTSVLSEVLIVALAGVPWNAGQVLLATKISCWLSTSILIIMLVVLLAVYLRPGGPPIPRTPNTVASVFTYLCASRMLEDFADLATVEGDKREERVNDMGRTYCLDVMDDGEGTARWTIDYDYEAS